MKKMRRTRRSKKALSPIIATILLIALVVVLALIILLWARGFISEVVEKEAGGVKKPANQVCGEVDLQASLSGTSLSLINRGSIPIYQVEIRTKSLGKIEVRRETIKLGPGYSTTISNVASDVEIIPVIKGKADNQLKAYACVNNPVLLE